MCISDWSSDVCSSDLAEVVTTTFPAIPAFPLISVSNEYVERVFVAIPNRKVNFVILDRFKIDQISNLYLHEFLGCKFCPLWFLLQRRSISKFFPIFVLHQRGLIYLSSAASLYCFQGLLDVIYNRA